MAAISEPPPYQVHATPAIGMEQSPYEFTRIFSDDDGLPFFQLDFARVLPARSVLREQTRPMLLTSS
jgi:hypothetical protein